MARILYLVLAMNNNRLTSLIAATLFAAIAMTVAACGGSSGASCDKVVAHVSELTGMKLEGERRTGAIEKCKKAPAAARDCMLKAKAVTDLAACAK